MKKTKFLAFVLVIAIAVMGAGYAYWTQELNITSTVNTGDLKLEFLPRLEGLDEIVFPNHGSYAYFDGEWFEEAEYMTVDSSISGEHNDMLEFTIDGIYPGSAGFLNFRIGNTGTVPAKVTNISAIATDQNKELLENFDLTIHSLTLYRTISIGRYERVIAYPHLGEALPIICNGLDDFANELKDRLDTVTLEPDMILVVNGEGSGYTVGLSHTISDNELERLVDDNAIKFDLDIEFTQGE